MVLTASFKRQKRAVMGWLIDCKRSWSFLQSKTAAAVPWSCVGSGDRAGAFVWLLLGARAGCSWAWRQRLLAVSCPWVPFPNELWAAEVCRACALTLAQVCCGAGGPSEPPLGAQRVLEPRRAHIERCSPGTGGWPEGLTPSSVWDPWPCGPAGGTPSLQQQRHRCSEANLPEERRSPVGKHLVAISSTCYLESGSRNRVGRNKAEIHSVSN